MKHLRFLQTLVLLLATVSGARVAAAQAFPTAAQPLQLSAFGAASGVFTGLEGGKNFSITAGGDLGLPVWHGLRPVVEVRATYPMDRGLIAAEKDALGGLRVNFLLGRRIHPYGDFLVGRGEVDYRLGYIFGDTIYDVTTTWVYSPGAGVDYDLTDRLSLKVDAQFQHWGDAPTASGSIYSSVGTVGVVYRFNFRDRRGMQ
jgi:hypothetical protein